MAIHTAYMFHPCVLTPSTMLCARSDARSKHARLIINPFGVLDLHSDSLDKKCPYTALRQDRGWIFEW